MSCVRTLSMCGWAMGTCETYWPQTHQSCAYDGLITEWMLEVGESCVLEPYSLLSAWLVHVASSGLEWSALAPCLYASSCSA
jgi:hypothetical protein